ncbi:hypothetical protein [Erythrobacter sp. WG]|nr:hypothetical protein [Erythrobacter sp. WG]MCX9146928.1 hypothetical protein [Erythrobacter sp. WG]
MNRAPASARALALPLAAAARIDSLEWARRIIVLGSAAALILAGRAFPF